MISYSKEAYNTFTPAANMGLSFIGTYVDVSQRTISMGMVQQLASYVNLSRGLHMVEFYKLTGPEELDALSPDIVVLRINTYYAVSMRYDASFENNSYTQLSDALEQNPSYIRVYSNSQFEVYVKTS